VTLSHLILLRHGETDWNAALRLQGHRDIPLNEQGVQQAEAAAPSVAALEPDVIVASDLRRAQRTAAPVAAITGLPVGSDPRLRETSLGDWEGLTREEVVQGWPGMWEQWRASSADYAPPNGESRSQVADRAIGVVHDLDGTEARRGLLVAHGGLIVGLTGRLLELPSDHWSVLTGIANCHWVMLHRFGIESGSPWRLHSYNAGLGSVVLPGGEDEVAGV
jgi:2,3-bisphosphoglycerate-dependent phosphoglycerate mutase/probable phosphoglycerate mutase